MGVKYTNKWCHKCKETTKQKLIVSQSNQLRAVCTKCNTVSK